MQDNPDSSSLPPLLCILRGKKPECPITSVVNETSIDLARRLLMPLSEHDYPKVAEQLSHHDDSDVEVMLDFMLFLICDGHLSNSHGMSDANRRARRFIFKVITKKLVMPKSLFLTGAGVKIGRDRDYIGCGGFGLVFKGELRGAPVALKVLHKIHNSIDFYQEALMWRSLRHEFVLPFLGIYEDDLASQFFLVSPYMNNGTLAHWRRRVNPSTSEIEDRMREVARGIQYIHSEGVVHGDLRGANVLLDDDCHVQIADFGLTRISEATATQSGTLHYNFAAPELFGYSFKTDLENSTSRTKMSDVFAFGCLYYEIHYDIMPFAGRNAIQIMKLVCAGERPPRLPEPPLCDQAWDLIQGCWESAASQRPVIEDVTKFMMDSDICNRQKIGGDRMTNALTPQHVRITKGDLIFIALFIVIFHFLRRLTTSPPDIYAVLPLLDVFIPTSPFWNLWPTHCKQPLITIEDWHVKAFRPKWFGLFGEPSPIIYQTRYGRKAHQISVVDLDKRDIEVQVWVDNYYMGPRDVELNSTVDCGEDIAKCFDLDFSSAVVVVPPGWHTVRAEIRKRNASEGFVWGKERQRRVMWLVQQCA